MVSLIWAAVRPHAFYLILIGLGLFGIRTWLADHDARLRAEIQVRDLQNNITDMQKQISAKQTDTQRQVQVVVKEVQAAKTPEQQIAEASKLETKPLNIEAVPSNPEQVTVQLAPLLEQLSECKQDAIKLGGCQSELALREQIETEQSKQVAVLKKKPSFLHRLASSSKKVAIGIAVGAVTVIAIRGIH